MTPLFDSNAHPRLDIAQKKGDFSSFKAMLSAAGFLGGCAVALPAKEGFEPRGYLRAAHNFGLFPVAAWNDVSDELIGSQIAALVSYGYRAIKIHPRLSGLSTRHARFRKVLRGAADVGLVVFQCCYQFSGGPLHPVDPLPELLDAIGDTPNVKMILLHGGTVELLRYSEAIRSNRNLLLDLSFTLNRYAGSSLDQDLRYLFRTFDQRICVGSDYPDYDPRQVRERFEALAEGLSEDKRANIGWRNISSFLGAT
jgi:predicted TIM-barrel fold metal-dependent hydrolase